MTSSAGAGRVVVVGASVAGVRCATTLRDAGHQGPVVLLDAESGPPYDKPQLSKHLRRDHELVLLADAPTLAARGIEHRPGERAESLDVTARVLRTDRGDLAFDHLVIATGSRPRTVPDLPPRAGYVRTRADWERLRVAVADGSLLVVGAGFLGLEAAAAVTSLGIRATVVDVATRVLGRGVPACVADVVAARHRHEGVDLRLGVEDPLLEGSGDGVRVDGVSAGFGLVAIGAEPDLGWLGGSGLRIDDGVLCDEALRAAPGIWAVGDAARWLNARYGELERHEHWTTAVRHAQHVARSIARGEATPMAELPYVWSDQFDWRVQCVGRIGAEVRHYEVGRDAHLAVSTTAGAVVGVTTVNAQALCVRARQLLTRRDPDPEELAAALRLDELQEVA